MNAPNNMCMNMAYNHTQSNSGMDITADKCMDTASNVCMNITSSTCMNTASNICVNITYDICMKHHQVYHEYAI